MRIWTVTFGKDPVALTKNVEGDDFAEAARVALTKLEGSERELTFKEISKIELIAETD